MKSVRSKSSTGAFNMVRPVPDELYHKIINSNSRYKDCTGYLIEKYSKLEDISILTELFQFLNTDIKSPIPKDHTLNLVLGIYNRTNSTHIDPPSENCALRILFNLGFADTYFLDPNYKVGDVVLNSGLDEHYLHMKENTYVILGPVTKSKYKIFVSNDKMIKVPGNGMEPARIVLRPSNYKRLTVVIDYMVAEGMVQRLAEVAAAKIPNLKVPAGSSKKSINEQIKKLQKDVSENRELQRELNSAINPPEPEIPVEVSNQVSDFEQEVLNSMTPEEREEIMKMMEGNK